MADEYLKAALYGIKTFNEKAKEKVGTMKLIELFNKRVIEKGLRDDEIFNGEEDVKENILYLPNLKSFVKWLVDNDKIDRKKYDRVYINTKESGILGIKDYEQLLMLLSISEKPIEFLISVLK